jgi:hypothetical protein
VVEIIETAEVEKVEVIDVPEEAKDAPVEVIDALVVEEELKADVAKVDEMKVIVPEEAKDALEEIDDLKVIAQTDVVMGILVMEDEVKEEQQVVLQNQDVLKMVKINREILHQQDQDVLDDSKLSC